MPKLQSYLYPIHFGIYNVLQMSIFYQELSFTLTRYHHQQIIQLFKLFLPTNNFLLIASNCVPLASSMVHTKLPFEDKINNDTQKSTNVTTPS